MRRRGFTLIEMMIAFAIMTLVATQLFVVTRETFHLWRNKMWEIDFGLKMRLVRERLLFQAVPYTGGDLYAGFLSATNISQTLPQLSAVFQYARPGGNSIEWGTDYKNAFPTFQINEIDDGKSRISDVQVDGPVFFVSAQTSLKTYDGKGASNRIERIAVPVWNRKDDSDKMPWEYFMEVQPGDAQWKF